MTMMHMLLEKKLGIEINSKLDAACYYYDSIGI
jgi:hypothetical protein